MKMYQAPPNAFVSGFQRSYKLVVAILVIGFVSAGVAAFKVHTKYLASASVLAIDGASQAGQDASDTASGAKNPVLLVDLPALATSGAVLNSVKNDLHGALTIDQLREGTRASGGGGSAIVHVQFVSKNPAIAIVTTNAIAHEVAMYFRTVSTERYNSVIKDITAQLAMLSKRLQDLDTELGTQAKQYPFVDVSSTSGGGGLSVYERLTQLRTMHDDAASAVAADEESLAASQKLIANSRPLAERDLSENDPVYKSLSEQYSKDNEELQHVKSFGNVSFPGLQELEATVASEAQGVANARKESLKRNLGSNSAYATANEAIIRGRGQLLADSARLASISADRAKLESDIGSGSIASDVARIRRDRDDTDAAYRALATKLSDAEANRAQAAATGSLMVLDHATFAAPQMLSSGAYMALGIVFLTIWIAGSVIMFSHRPEPRRAVDPIYNFDGHVSNLTHEDVAATASKTPQY